MGCGGSIGSVLAVWMILAAQRGGEASFFQKKGFFFEQFKNPTFAKKHECATDGCTVGHLYLSQMIFGQGDPWSLV